LDKQVNQPVTIGVNSAPGCSAQNAASLGTPVRTIIERGDAYLTPQLYNLEITVLETIRGKDASERVRNEGLKGTGPRAGAKSHFDFLLVRIKLGYTRKVRGLGDEFYSLTDGQFVAVSSDNKTEYEIPSVLKQPQPQLLGEIFSPGDSREGWLLLQVPEDEKKPFLIFKRKHIEGVYGIWGHVWFKLYQC
jgi:hypothetical protein